MVLLVVGVVVDAQHEGHVRVGRGGRDDHLLRAGVEMLLGVLPLREKARRLDHDLDAEIAPGKRGGIPLGQELELLAVDD